ncbi:competence type IV pilus minor pilin ComGE [Neobacillus sp. GCM10023253]|uniref:competence type IV pilus minor pilin ComGE n=1 Tax=Neobacillus sp. GCM10023253 TaxID=3252644 RepID=UPI0036206994
MLQNNKGFFLLELLLSLSAMFLICLVFIPSVTDLRKQSVNFQIEKKMRQIMYEELEAKLIDNRTFANYTLVQNEIRYQITWKDSFGQKEVCVKVEKTPLHLENEICGSLE